MVNVRSIPTAATFRMAKGSFTFNSEYSYLSRLFLGVHMHIGVQLCFLRREHTPSLGMEESRLAQFLAQLSRIIGEREI